MSQSTTINIKHQFLRFQVSPSLDTNCRSSLGPQVRGARHETVGEDGEKVRGAPDDTLHEL